MEAKAGSVMRIVRKRNLHIRTCLCDEASDFQYPEDVQRLTDIYENTDVSDRGK